MNSPFTLSLSFALVEARTPVGLLHPLWIQGARGSCLEMLIPKELMYFSARQCELGPGSPSISPPDPGDVPAVTVCGKAGVQTRGPWRHTSCSEPVPSTPPQAARQVPWALVPGTVQPARDSFPRTPGAPDGVSGLRSGEGADTRCVLGTVST